MDAARLLRNRVIMQVVHEERNRLVGCMEKQVSSCFAFLSALASVEDFDSFVGVTLICIFPLVWLLFKSCFGGLDIVKGVLILVIDRANKSKLPSK